MIIKIEIPDVQIPTMCEQLNYVVRKEIGETQNAFIVRMMGEYVDSLYAARKRRIDKNNQDNRLSAELAAARDATTSIEVIA
jgi:hypothetical protein